MTWAVQRRPQASTIWEEEVKAAGASIIELPAVENCGCCDSKAKVTALLKGAGFTAIKTWTEEVVHGWRPEDHFNYQLQSTWREEIDSLSLASREDCLSRVRTRLAGLGKDQYLFRGSVVVATALKRSPRR